MRNLFGVDESDHLARLAGLLYFLTLPTAGPWYYLSATMLGGGAATLANLEAGRDTLEFVIVIGAVGHVVQLVSAVILYRLLSPSGKLAAGLALALLAVSLPLSFAAMARQMDVLALLDLAGAASPLGTEQLQAQITLAAHSYASLVRTAALFWGLWLFPLGWALLRSGLVPRVLGVLVILGGPFYAMAFFGPLLITDYSGSVVDIVVGFASGIPDLVGEIGTALWLLTMGTRARKTVTPAAVSPATPST